MYMAVYTTAHIHMYVELKNTGIDDKP